MYREVENMASGLMRSLINMYKKGEPLQDQTLTDQWYACFENSNTPDEDLVMVDFYVIPIWDIVEVLNPSKAQEIEDYITNKYLKK